MNSHVNRQPMDRPWRIWDLDAEMRYWPVVDALAGVTGPVCEIGSGPAGLASWTDRQVIGVDPGGDERHGDFRALPNLERVVGDGAHIPLASDSVAVAVAVDTFEHIPQPSRHAVAAELVRITRPGGRVVVIGPTGPAARAGDAWLLETFRRRDRVPDWAVWLAEHVEMGVPTVDEMVSLFSDEPVVSVAQTGVLNVRLWQVMHLAALRGPRLGPAHVPLWGSFARLARRYHRGPFYRWMFVAEIGPS